MSTLYGMTVTFGGGSVSDELVPRITVTAPTGSTVTVTKGDVTLTATEKSGVWVFDLPEFGTWVVTATNGTKTATETIVMDSARAVSLSYFSATIAATYPAGSTCTCSNGTTTLTAPDTSGRCTFIVTGTGAWTVSATDGESYVAKSVSIANDGQAATCTLEYPSAAPVLLWTNARPTSNFGAQTISVASGYDAFLIEVMYATWTYEKTITYLNIGGGLQGAAANRPSVGVYTGRKVTTTNTTLAFKRGGWPENDDSAAIPTRIWGVKFAL